MPSGGEGRGSGTGRGRDAGAVLGAGPRGDGAVLEADRRWGVGVGSAGTSEVGPGTAQRQDEAPEGKGLEEGPDAVGRGLGGTRQGAGPTACQGGGAGGRG